MGKWHYLNSEPFKSRLFLAASYLRDCQNIIEIGGYKTPITDFLYHPFEQVVSVDPLIEPRMEKNILHTQADFREFDFSPYTNKTYALVLIGMDLPFTQKLYTLIACAKRIIIEFPPDHGPPCKLFEEINLRINLKQDLKIGFDFSGNDFGDLSGSSPVFPRRMFYVCSQLDPIH